MGNIDEIKQKIDIVELVSGYVKLSKSGKNFKGVCPFHSEKTPSFFVFPEQQSWHCFGACGTGGDIFSFVMKKEGIDFGQALQLLAERAGVRIERAFEHDNQEEKQKELVFTINQTTAEYYHKLLQDDPEAETARKYVEGRGLRKDTIDKFLLGYCRRSADDLYRYLSAFDFKASDLLAAGVIMRREDGSIHDRFNHRLVFPISDYQGKIIGFGCRALDNNVQPKYLNSPQTAIFDKSSVLYALDKAKNAIRQHGNVIIMEGYMDVLTAHQNGWENAIASMGTALTEKHLGIIKKFTSNLILSLDSDSAGEDATIRIAESVNMENYFNSDVKVVVTPEGKDPDEVIKNHPEAWKTAVDNARPLTDFIIDIIRDKYDLKTAAGKQQAVEKVLPVIEQVKEPVRRGEYIQKLSKAVNVNESDLIDVLKKLKQDEAKPKFGKKPNKMLSSGTATIVANKRENLIANLEDICLSMILHFPILKEPAFQQGNDIFENAQNMDIYAKWVQYGDADSIKANLEASLYPHFENIISRKFPELANKNDEFVLQTFSSYLMRLNEQRNRLLAAKKAEMWQQEAAGVNNLEDVARLEESGISEGEQIKKYFHDGKQRKQIAA
jgi:DNA primase